MVCGVILGFRRKVGLDLCFIIGLIVFFAGKHDIPDEGLVDETQRGHCRGQLSNSAYL
jgi:hypothetical protein